jgi:hypothetical protein
MLFPFDGFKHALYRNGPAVLAKPSILDRKEELAHRLLNELYEAVSEFDNRFYELAHAYIGLKQQNEALKSISDRDVRSRIARKLSDELFSRLSSPTSVLMRDQLLGALERFVQNGEKPLKAQLS